jgi:hypothetical protein
MNYGGHIVYWLKLYLLPICIYHIESCLFCIGASNVVQYYASVL